MMERRVPNNSKDAMVLKGSPLQKAQAALSFVRSTENHLASLVVGLSGAVSQPPMVTEVPAAEASERNRYPRSILGFLKETVLSPSRLSAKYLRIILTISGGTSTEERDTLASQAYRGPKKGLRCQRSMAPKDILPMTWPKVRTETKAPSE